MPQTRNAETNRAVHVAATATAGFGARILLVEDNPVNQKLVLAILIKKGYGVDIVNHGCEAIDRIESAEIPYDAVLMDVQMLVLDGLEPTRLLCRDPRWAELPIIAMTAHSMTGDRERCLQARMNVYLQTRSARASYFHGGEFSPVIQRTTQSGVAGLSTTCAERHPTPLGVRWSDQVILR